MRIGFVSTYPPIECGIATYTQYLTDALEKSGHQSYVFSPYGCKGDHAFGCYSQSGKNIAANIYLMASKMTPDLIHIQHEFGLYGEPKGIQIIELILRCREVALPVITTFHTVKDEIPIEEEIVLRVIIQESSAIIVHEETHKNTLIKYFGYKDKITVIPHGIREISPIDGARKKVGVEGKKVALLCGYLRQTKRFDRAIKVFPEIAEAVPNAVLVLASKSRGINHPEFQNEIYKMIEESPARDRIITLYGQFPAQAFDTIISASDIVILPYELGGQSGIMAHAFAFGKPVVSSDLRAFREWIEESQGGLVAASDEELASHSIKLLSDDKYRESLSSNIVKFIKNKTSWKVVAKQHIKVYEKCAWRPAPFARYFG